MIQAAIFDMDGTLLDSNPYWDKAPAAWLTKLGKRAKPDLAKTIFTMTLPEATDYLIGEYGLRQSPGEIIRGINDAMESFYLHDVPLKAGIQNLIRALNDRGIPCAIASVTDRYLVEKALSRFGLLSSFAAIVTTDDVGVGKNQPDIYLRAADLLGSPPEKTLVFEDAPHAIATAKRGNFRTVGIYDEASADRQDALRADCDFYLRDYSDFSAILAAL
ncbi:MAG: HAD family phosphatase [Lachnospiraceae bacterium]|nr:HAD family phosphatase [Lachnospiraceae bacterium]